MRYSAVGTLPNPEATEKLGKRLARVLRNGDTLLLFGQIGSGKTHLARAIIQALHEREGIPQVDVPSPTYTLVQTYDLKIGTIVHADLYRLGDAGEVAELGLEDAFDNAITLVEWPEIIESPPLSALSVRLAVEGDGRSVEAASQSERWSDIASIAIGLDA